MTVDQMIEMLTEIAENGGGHRPVQVALQPSYPLSAEVRGIADGNDLIEYAEDPDEEMDEDAVNAVWIATGNDNGYTTSAIWRAAQR